MTPGHTSVTCIAQSTLRPIVNRESKDILIVAIALFFVVIKQRPCIPDYQEFLYGTKQLALITTNSQDILDFRSVATLSATQSLSTNPQ